MVMFGFEEVTFFYDYWEYTMRKTVEGILEQFGFDVREKEVVVVDSFGHRDTVVVDLRGREPKTLTELVIYDSYKRLGRNLVQITEPMEDLFLIYHSDMDTVDKVDVGKVEIARDYVRQFL